VRLQILKLLLAAVVLVVQGAIGAFRRHRSVRIGVAGVFVLLAGWLGGGLWLGLQMGASVDAYEARVRKLTALGEAQADEIRSQQTLGAPSGPLCQTVKPAGTLVAYLGSARGLENVRPVLVGLSGDGKIGSFAPGWARPREKSFNRYYLHYWGSVLEKSPLDWPQAVARRTAWNPRLDVRFLAVAVAQAERAPALRNDGTVDAGRITLWIRLVDLAKEELVCQTQAASSLPDLVRRSLSPDSPREFVKVRDGLGLDAVVQRAAETSVLKALCEASGPPLCEAVKEDSRIDPGWPYRR
jgi:hypothetical protein